MAIKKVIIDKANRLYQMPPSIMAFARSERKSRLLRKPKTIDLGTFVWPVQYDADLVVNPSSLQPASPEKLSTLKEEISNWITASTGTRSFSEKEIFIGGSITSLIHSLALTYLDHGDIAFVPNLGIPLYREAVTAAGGEPIAYALSPGNDWLPSLDRVQTRLGKVARVLFLNSPHNPTGAVLGEKEMTDLVWVASRENILLLNDAAYRGIAGNTAASLLAVEGGKKVGVEVYSFAYQFGLPALPFGFVAGNREVIRSLQMTASLVPAHIPDYYVSLALQGIRQYPSENLRAQRDFFREASAESRKLMERLSLQRCGFDTVPFAWARLEKRSNSLSAARILHRRHRILAVPGTSLGESGQGYLRFSLTAGPQAFSQATAQIRKKTRLLRASGD